MKIQCYCLERKTSLVVRVGDLVRDLVEDLPAPALNIAPLNILPLNFTLNILPFHFFFSSPSRHCRHDRNTREPVPKSGAAADDVPVLCADLRGCVNRGDVEPGGAPPLQLRSLCPLQHLQGSLHHRLLGILRHSVTGNCHWTLGMETRVK